MLVVHKPRSKAAESHRARCKEASALVKHPSTKQYTMTPATRGASTEVFGEMMKSPELKVLPKPPPGSGESLATRLARKAALARWHPATNVEAALTAQNGLMGEAATLMDPAAEVRHWRRGESAINGGSYRQASVQETLDIIDKISSKQLKWTELDVMYNAGKTRVSGGTIRKYVYGSDAPAKLAKLKEKMAFEQQGAPRQVRAPSHRPLSLSHFSLSCCRC